MVRGWVHGRHSRLISTHSAQSSPTTQVSIGFVPSSGHARTTAKIGFVPSPELVDCGFGGVRDGRSAKIGFVPSREWCDPHQNWLRSVSRAPSTPELGSFRARGPGGFMRRTRATAGSMEIGLSHPFPINIASRGRPYQHYCRVGLALPFYGSDDRASPAIRGDRLLGCFAPIPGIRWCARRKGLSAGFSKWSHLSSGVVRRGFEDRRGRTSIRARELRPRIPSGEPLRGPSPADEEDENADGQSATSRHPSTDDPRTRIIPDQGQPGP
jgi:hypothetical protein